MPGMKSNYQPLWEYVVKAEKFPLKMTFKEIEILLGIPLNHAFLSEKKQLLKIGIVVEKISLKEKYIIFNTARR